MSNDRIQAFLERNKDKLSSNIRPKYAPAINSTPLSTSRKLIHYYLDNQSKFEFIIINKWNR